MANNAKQLAHKKRIARRKELNLPVGRPRRDRSVPSEVDYEGLAQGREAVAAAIGEEIALRRAAFEVEIGALKRSQRIAVLEAREFRRSRARVRRFMAMRLPLEALPHKRDGATDWHGRILEHMAKSPPGTRFRGRDIAIALGGNNGCVAPALSRLLTKGAVDRPEFGTYTLKRPRP